ncbi:MAG: amidohydrolase family protein [Chloroflexota bacterium]
MRTLITNIGEIISGDLDTPLLDADSILIDDGRIASVGRGLTDEAHVVVDAKGSTVAPGLIDSHSHPAIGDFTPRQRTVDFYQSGLHGGVTTAVSAGEPHVPGRPKDIVGLKALAIVAAKSYANLRPGGVKVHAGAPILEVGLEEADFAEMAAGGVTLVGEIGLGSVKTAEQAAPMVLWARKHGMTSTIHTGGPSLPGSSAIGADIVLETAPDIVGHINGGTTSMPRADIERLVGSDMALEIVHNGNGKTALDALELAQAAGALDRVILGTDSPSGSGVMPLGMLRLVAHLSALGKIAPEVAFCFATGNTARVHGLDVGAIEPGRAADLIVMDAPMGSVGSSALEALANGDLPGISMVLIDGQILAERSRNTPPAARMAAVERR